MTYYGFRCTVSGTWNQHGQHPDICPPRRQCHYGVQNHKQGSWWHCLLWKICNHAFMLLLLPLTKLQYYTVFTSYFNEFIYILFDDILTSNTVSNLPWRRSSVYLALLDIHDTAGLYYRMMHQEKLLSFWHPVSRVKKSDILAKPRVQICDTVHRKIR